MADDNVIHEHLSLRANQVGWTHQIELRWFHYGDGGPRDATTHHLIMSIDDAEDLLVSLTQAIRLTRDRQLDDARRGQCDTCRGTRMISKEVHGRMVNSHSCPDCLPADVWEGPMPSYIRKALEVHDA